MFIYFFIGRLSYEVGKMGCLNLFVKKCCIWDLDFFRREMDVL